jgi:hypothetical protein
MGPSPSEPEMRYATRGIEEREEGAAMRSLDSMKGDEGGEEEPKEGK